MDVCIEDIKASAYRVPTDKPESDGTLEWDHTTIVIVQATAGDSVGLGYTYTHPAAVQIVRDPLGPIVKGRSALSPRARWQAMVAAVRNIGNRGLATMAISAVDIALWDLKARLLELPLCSLLGPVRDSSPLYGSGGFTSYSLKELEDQLWGWVEAGIPRVKMKVGRRPEHDGLRVRAARAAIGSEAELFVDANGAYAPKQALAMARAFAALGVTWFEEPVSSDDLEGLRFIRDRVPAGMEVSAGEYASLNHDFRRMIEAGAIDVLQADITRCGGVTGFMDVSALCTAYGIPLSCHTAPLAHLHVAVASPPVRHMEYFHDHVRIERMLFDGLPEPEGGALAPDRSRPGIGAELREADATRFSL